MARIDQLPPDQRAALQLILQQGRSYDEIAALLRIEPAAVRERARAALDALGPEEVPGLTLERQDEVADYLLGQQAASERESTRRFLAGSAAGRAWARAVSGELRPMADDNLPEIPAEEAEVDEAFGALQARTEHRERVARSSKLGGIILLVGLGIAIAVIIALIVGGGDDEGGGDRARTAQTQPASELVAQINLTPPQGRDSDALGVATVQRAQGQLIIGIIGQDVPRTTNQRAYAVWLTGEGVEPQRLGFTPPVGEDGRLQGVAPLPDNAERFDRVIVTRESENDPASPGTVVLSGQLQLQGGQAQGGGQTQPQGGGQTQPQGAG